MDNMHEYDVIPLGNGVDLRSSRVLSKPGALVNCLNREVIDAIGLKRIDGFEPYDGSSEVYNPDYKYITSYTFYDLFNPGQPLVVVGNEDVIFGVCAGFDSVNDYPNEGDTSYRMYYAVVNDLAEPYSGAQVTQVGTSYQFDVDEGPLSVINTAHLDAPNGLGLTAAQTVTLINGFSTELRQLKTSPGNNQDVPPIGVHWWRDRLYAVMDDYWFYFDNGDTEVAPNMILGTATGGSGFGCRVLSVQLHTGTWGTSDARGIIQVEVLKGTLPASGTALNVYDDEAFTTNIDSAVIEVMNAAGWSPATPPNNPRYASLWESKSFQQALDEDNDHFEAGWHRIDLGFEADYDTGTSDSGGLTIVQRGVENNFTFTNGDEESLGANIFNGTNLVGTEFAPRTWNFISTTERVDQGYPGWKTNASATTWADQEDITTGISASDSNYAYANIWYSGTGDPASAVQTPGVLNAIDKAIAGPGITTAAPATVGTIDFASDTDWFTTQARAPLVFNDFGAAAALMPAGAIISGVEVVVDYDSKHYAYGQFAADRNGTNGANITSNTVDWIDGSLSWGAQLCRSTSSIEATSLGTTQYQTIVVPTGAYQEDITSSADTDTFRIAKEALANTATIGGLGNTFGVSNLKRSDLLDPEFSVALFGQVTAAPAYPIGFTSVTPSGHEYVLGQVRLKVDTVVIRFYYTVPSARYYVADGTNSPNNDVCSVDVVYYVTQDGSWSAGTAEGKVQYTNLIPDVRGTKRTVKDNDMFYLSADDAEDGVNPVLSINGTPDYNGLPALNRITEESSRYQFVTANYFGREDWDGFYGVSGAGRAFSFAKYDADGDGDNEQYMVNIVTNTEDIEGDKPRHLAYFQNALALGYTSGVVRISVPGQPENFDGSAGAGELGFGDHVHGLLPLEGATLAVYCEGSVHALVGNTVDNFAQQVLIPEAGAIEYSVVNVAGTPVHCSANGITTLQQSEKYGNFIGSRLSSPITPWILNRMFRDSAKNNELGIACAYMVRSKNQYRVHFKDGLVLVMTLNPESPPSFTFSRYIMNGEDTEFFVPIAWSSNVDQDGVERIHLVHFSDKSLISAPDNTRVYEFDRGWGFAGEWIEENYALNWFHRNPFTTTNVKNVALDGLTLGVGYNTIVSARNYSMLSGLNPSYIASPVEIGIPYPQASRLMDTYIPGSRNAGGVAESGTSLAFKISGRDSGIGPVPPDIHQALLIQYTLGGKTLV